MVYTAAVKLLSNTHKRVIEVLVEETANKVSLSGKECCYYHLL